MGKKKVTVESEGNTLTISGSAEAITDALQEAVKKAIQITSASIKEELCNYGYEIMTGPCAGDKIPNRKGSSMVHEDMIEAFKKLNVHLAIIDDAFKYSGKELTSIDNLEDTDIAGLFAVTGFKITGSEENEGIILVGEKWVSHGSIALETPKMTSGSNYPFFTELKESVDHARAEVEEYMNGKSAPRFEQGEMDFAAQPASGSEDEFDEPLEIYDL